MTERVVINRRFRGPPESGNGGDLRTVSRVTRVRIA